MNASHVGLEASEAGEHQDGEEEGHHGEAQTGVSDQGQGLQIPLQLLLRGRGEEGERGSLDLYHYFDGRWTGMEEEKKNRN